MNNMRTINFTGLKIKTREPITFNILEIQNGQAGHPLVSNKETNNEVVIIDIETVEMVKDLSIEEILVAYKIDKISLNECERLLSKKDPRELK